MVGCEQGARITGSVFEAWPRLNDVTGERDFLDARVWGRGGEDPYFHVHSLQQITEQWQRRRGFEAIFAVNQAKYVGGLV